MIGRVKTGLAAKRAARFPARGRLASIAAVLGMLAAATVEGAPNPGFDDGTRSLNMALFDYVERNNILALRSIVEAGADITGLNAAGRSALDVAIGRGHFEIANYLILSRKMQARGPGNLPAAVPGARHAPARSRPVFSRLRAARSHTHKKDSQTR